MPIAASPFSLKIVEFPFFATGKLLLLRAHADALDRLEELAFGLDARCDDQLRFLKLSDIARTDIAHAGHDCAHQILRSVVHRRRSKEDLLQRPGDSDLNPRAARQVGVRGSHAPVISLSGRLLGASKGTA